MSYEHLRTETPRARKQYRCDAYDLICEHLCVDDELDDFEKELVENHSGKINKGDEYMKSTGIYDGEFYSARALSVFNDICVKYDLYNE